ncbi:response regulator [Peribacillus cavernae]|uniref:Response regulator n=1 Tax=Peribacillus cavernae TaxID=1674310 RepID=A0A3S0VH44_9BACI|nr:response regulator [Peribacillus cavernae]MDQ0220261.1 two-component system response regulator DctR [Peribacillus cavernae]RUQ31924.1 response regulator [Peribacillus cavernae]
MIKESISVLLIEDDPMVQEVNKQFIERVNGFKVTDVASNGQEGLRKIMHSPPDLVILDIFMPVQDGIDTLYEIRKQQADVDVIVISAANDQKTIRKMIQNGAFDYLIKPFKFERLKQTLEKYYRFRTQVQKDNPLSQSQLDKMIFQKDQGHSADQRTKEALPKGLNEATLNQIIEFLNLQASSLSAEEVADGIGIARVTARRYLDYLKGQGVLHLDTQYGSIGRPINKYILKKHM